jgi:hypothetical protein
MENEANPNQSDPKHPAPSQDAGLNIETVTPDTEKETPDTGLPNGKDNKESTDKEEEITEETDETEPEKETQGGEESAPDQEQEHNPAKSGQASTTQAPETHVDDHGIETIAP